MTLRRPDPRWVTSATPDASAAASLATRLQLPSALARLLVVRGITDERVARSYLRPAVEELGDPAQMAGMQAAVERLADAIRRGETILVHGDYDVDGICSTTLLTRSIRALGGRALPFIPDRQRDGYDLSSAGVAQAVRQQASLVVTCDCGTTAVAPALELQRAGIDLIITDHHLPGAALPPAVAILNPRRPDDTSADKDLAAVGVAFKLALALTRHLGGNDAVVYNQMDLVALATVADVAPLRGENRIFVRKGLALMAETRNVGLRALIRAAGLDGKEMTAGRIGFILAPRLNALGRIDRALRGVELLLADDEATANTIARECEERNRERQDLDRATLEQVMRRVDALEADASWGIAIADRAWHPGVIGIVASRVVETTGRPTFLIAVQDGVGKGSGRSVPAFDLHAALGACADLLDKHGGHRAAAGLTIQEARVEAFAERFNAVAQAQLTTDDLRRTVHLDLELPLGEATAELERLLRHVEPFGVANPAPTFVARGLAVGTGARRIGTDGVKCVLTDGETSLEAVGWGMAGRSQELAAGRRVDVAYKLERNVFRGAESLQLALVDFKPAA
ncbi:MAG: single-stranded-DNA-specific exonuclease RecJ [Gemmatimonadetes bacterium]|nr:single-stranded-DNA-specific exonuclease RecJ [Gemmatimonadota bacterium]